MQKELDSQNRYEFISEFVRLGYKNSFRTFRAMVMLTNVRLAKTNELITDQLWFNYTKGFLKLGELEEGDLIKFSARVNGCDEIADAYGYKFKHPSKIQLVDNKKKRQLLPIDDNAAIVGYAMKKSEPFQENNKSVAQWYIARYNNWLKRKNLNKGY